MEKKGGCGDYQVLNSITRKDRYTLPLLRDFAQNLARMKCFSMLDLMKAYYQVLLSPSVIPKTAIVTPFESWKFTKLPFGVCNAVPSFQRMIDCVLAFICALLFR